MLMPSYPEANMALGKLLATAGNRDELTTDHTAIQEVEYNTTVYRRLCALIHPSYEYGYPLCTSPEIKAIL